MSQRIDFALAGIVTVALSCGVAVGDDYDPPAGYYTGATGTGSTLKSQLTTAMSTGHIQRTYGQFRYMTAIISEDPNNSGNILLCYNRASVAGNWDNGTTWNREHVWPQSRQPGSASNSTMGNLGDPHALLPCNPSINGSRGNDPFGFGTNFGTYGPVGSSWFPGDDDKGDIARSLFYSDTRWTSLGIALVAGTPGANQMGDLPSLVAWHFIDPPDDFERRRNHRISSQVFNPNWYTNNRNAYIDRPEYVWSVYVDQLNDSQLYVGAGPASDGSSSTVVLGDMLVGSGAPSELVVLNKNGDDGTFYEVVVGGDATSDVSGRHNAFEIGSDGDFATITVGVDPGAVASVGDVATGTVTIDNLDVTTGGGTGVGANDGDDVVSFSVTVVDASVPSLSGTPGDFTQVIDLGTIDQHSGDAMVAFDINNLTSTPGFTAPLDVVLDSSLGDTGVLTTSFATISGLGEGGSQVFTAIMDDAAVGTFSASYTFATSDHAAVSGAQSRDDLTVFLVGSVVAGVCDGDANDDDLIDVNDISYVLFRLGDPGPDGDVNGDNIVDVNDLSYVLFRLGNPC